MPRRIGADQLVWVGCRLSGAELQVGSVKADIPTARGSSRRPVEPDLKRLPPLTGSRTVSLRRECQSRQLGIARIGQKVVAKERCRKLPVTRQRHGTSGSP